jgi:hypothetical protein
MFRIAPASCETWGAPRIGLLLETIAQGVLALAVPLFTLNAVETHSLRSDLSHEASTTAENLIGYLSLCQAMSFGAVSLWIVPKLERVDRVVVLSLGALALAVALLLLQFSFGSVILLAAVLGFEQSVLTCLKYRMDRRAMFSQLLLDALQPSLRPSFDCSTKGAGMVVGLALVPLLAALGTSTWFLCVVIILMISGALLAWSELADQQARPLTVDQMVPNTGLAESIIHFCTTLVPRVNHYFWVLIAKEMFSLDNINSLGWAFVIISLPSLIKRNQSRPSTVPMSKQLVSLVLLLRTIVFGAIAHVDDGALILLLAGFEVAITSLIEPNESDLSTNSSVARALGGGIGAFGLTYAFQVGNKEDFPMLVTLVAIGMLLLGMFANAASAWSASSDALLVAHTSDEKSSSEAHKILKVSRTVPRRPPSPSLSTVVEEDEHLIRSRRGSVGSAWSGGGRPFGETVVEWETAIDRVLQRAEETPVDPATTLTDEGVNSPFAPSKADANSPRRQFTHDTNVVTRMMRRRSSDLSSPGKAGTVRAALVGRRSFSAVPTPEDGSPQALFLSSPAVPITRSGKLKRHSTSESERSIASYDAPGAEPPSATHSQIYALRYASSEEVRRAFSDRACKPRAINNQNFDVPGSPGGSLSSTIQEEREADVAAESDNSIESNDLVALEKSG